MRAGTAVSIDNDLSAGKTGIALRSANNKLAGRVYIVLGLFIDQICRYYFMDDFS